MIEDFAVFILTFGRPDNVKTYNTLKEYGYTGDIYLICSTDDKSLSIYKEKYGDHVIVFDKKDYQHIDVADNFKETRSVIYARNANIDIAKRLGLKYYLQLDDDYRPYYYKIIEHGELKTKKVFNLDKLFSIFLEFMLAADLDCLAPFQAGDYIGGAGNDIFHSLGRRRKVMNTFFCEPIDHITLLEK